MSFDSNRIRRQFPVFQRQVNGQPLHYLDSAAMAQVPQQVIDAVVQYETHSRANVQRSVYRMATESTDAYQGARAKVANYLNAYSDEEVIFTSGTTAAINLLAYGFEANLKRGDEIVISLAEHHSNFVPWQMLQKRCGITLKTIPLGIDGSFNLDNIECLITERCRLVAVTHASNVTGAITDVKTIVTAAKKVGARVFLDGAQAAPHGPIDVQALDVDFYAFSGHKCYAPTGVGVLWGKQSAQQQLTPVVTGGGMVERVSIENTSFASGYRAFEAGTPPIAQAIGLGVAVDWLQNQPWRAIRQYERELGQQLLSGLKQIDGLQLLGSDSLNDRLPIFTFSIERLHPHDICHILDQHGVALRGGHHCAQPLLAEFNVFAATRASFAIYNNAQDIEVLIEGLRNALEILR